MDAFFASVEQHDHPELRGLPVIIGGSPEERGVVSTCSYEARTFGIHSAMPASRARRLCPHGIFLPGNYARYKEISEEIREIFRAYTDLVEPVSIDEAYLDVTVNHYNISSATRLAQMIQCQIYERTGLTASAGVSYNKFLAKVASDLRKPAGLSVIPPEDAEAFLEALPIAKFHGIGKVTAEKLRSMGIRYGADLKKMDLPLLLSHFGKTGEFYYRIVRGEDDRPVEAHGERKSVGKENTFPRDISNLRRIRLEIRELAAQVASRLQRRHLAGKTVTLKVRYGDFRTITRAKSLRMPVERAGNIAQVALQLLKKTEAGTLPVRLLGVTVSNFCTESDRNEAEQLEFDF
ncbi:MAG: DNA polymerase IV [Lentisphaeria bacterium]|nr:DNA polymerase IV [Lentisphaeria bacterium]